MTSDAFACFTKPMKGNLNHLIIFSVYRTLGPVIVTRTSPLFFAIFFPVNLQVASISIYNNSAVIRAAEQFFTYRNCRREQKIKLLYARRLLAIFQFLRFFRLYLFLCFFFFACCCCVEETWIGPRFWWLFGLVITGRGCGSELGFRFGFGFACGFGFGFRAGCLHARSAGISLIVSF